VHGEPSSEIAGFLKPGHQYSQSEVLASPSPVPAEAGVYGWWFRSLPTRIDVSKCCRHQGLTLLYVGISPDRPPTNGRAASKQNLRKRLRQHYTRTAAASTLRRTLGCLLAKELGLHLQLAGSSGRRTNFGNGERVLSDWMAANALVSWHVREQPWEFEDELIQQLDLPLNLKGNQRNPFHSTLTYERARCLAEARAGQLTCEGRR
jgi:hypothetical protein